MLPHCVQDSPDPRRQSHTAEEPGAHGSIRNSGLLLAGGGAPGVSGVSAELPVSLIGAFAYDVTALCLCRLFPHPLDPLA